MHQAGYHTKPELIGNERDLKDIQAALVRFYEGLSEHNLEMLENATAPGFHLLEHGEYWSLEYTKQQIGRQKPPGFARRNRFEFKRIEVFGDQAFAVWDLFAHVKREGKETDLYWLESGTFRKIADSWKVHFLHSTRGTVSGS
jgi:hypothetical protein